MIPIKRNLIQTFSTNVVGTTQHFNLSFKKTIDFFD